MLQGFLGEAGADPAGEQEAVRTLVADQQSAEVFAAAFWRGVAADDNLLRRVSLTLTQAPLRRPDQFLPLRHRLRILILNFETLFLAIRKVLHIERIGFVIIQPLAASFLLCFVGSTQKLLGSQSSPH